MIDERIAIRVRPLDDLRIADLSRTAFAAQLPHDLDLMVPSHHVRLGEQAAVGVHRQRAADFDSPALRERRRFARLAETPSLEGDPREDREGIVGEKRIDIIRRYSRYFVYRLKFGLVVEDRLLRDAHPGIRPDEFLATRRQTLHPADEHRTFATIARAFRSRDDHTCGAVVDEAIVEQMQRLANEARALMLLDAERLAHHRDRIHRG